MLGDRETSTKCRCDPTYASGSSMQQQQLQHQQLGQAQEPAPPMTGGDMNTYGSEGPFQNDAETVVLFTRWGRWLGKGGAN